MIIIRGAGDISTGTIHRLFRAGFPVLALETDHPSAIRRQVAFSEEAACKLGRAEEETGPAPSTSQTSTVDVMVETPHVVCSLFCARL